jgi:hypothetical protein
VSGGAEQVSGDARIAEVRRGLERRISAVNSVTGTAQVEYRFSPRNCAEADKRAQDRAEWLGLNREIPPVDALHKSLWFFSFDQEKTRWRGEAVDLTNSGRHLWTSSGSLIDPALNRHLPPETFHRVAISDGTRAYQYSWSGRRGRIAEHPRAELLLEWMLPVERIESDVIRGTSSTFAECLHSPEYQAVFEGEEELAGHRCLKITVRRSRPFLSGWYITAWIVPDLDFAAVREERSHCPGGWAPGGAPPWAPYKWITQAGDFARVSDILWCPQTVQQERFDYIPPEQVPWDYTRIIRMRTLELNTPLQGIEITEDFPPKIVMLDFRRS